MFDMRCRARPHAFDRRDLVGRGRDPAQQPGRHDDRVQRVAQIVAQDADERLGEPRLLLRLAGGAAPRSTSCAVAAGAGVFDLAEQPRVLDRERGAIGQRAREREVVLAVHASRLRHRERDRAQHLPPTDQRHAHVRAAGRSSSISFRCSSSTAAAVSSCARDLGHQLRLPGADDLVDAGLGGRGRADSAAPARRPTATLFGSTCAVASRLTCPPSTMSTAHQSASAGTASRATAASVCFVVQRRAQLVDRAQQELPSLVRVALGGHVAEHVDRLHDGAGRRR